jgi:hypothetical protein
MREAEFAFGAALGWRRTEIRQDRRLLLVTRLRRRDEISGNASAELQDDGTIEIELSYNNADDAILIGHRD